LLSNGKWGFFSSGARDNLLQAGAKTSSLLSKKIMQKMPGNSPAKSYA